MKHDSPEGTIYKLSVNYNSISAGMDTVSNWAVIVFGDRVGSGRGIVSNTARGHTATS